MLAAGLAVLFACGDDNGPTGPSGNGGGSGGGSGATITIGANGAVSPAEVTVSVGQTVTFTNNHTSAHEISSDPHPTHTNCPPINSLGRLAAGQTRTTASFTSAGTCGFHDHLEPGNAGLRGTITIR